MASKTMVGASLLLAACGSLTGCQTTSAPPRNPNPPFVQRQGSVNPPLAAVNPQAAPPGAITPASASNAGGWGSGAPSPTNVGSQARSTAPGFIPASGPGPASFGNPNSPPPGFGAPTGASTNPVASSDSPILPPPNPVNAGAR